MSAKNIIKILCTLLTIFLLTSAACEKTRPESEFQELQGQLQNVEADKNKAVALQKQLKEKLDEATKAQGGQQQQLVTLLNAALEDEKSPLFEKTKLKKKIEDLNKSERLLRQPIKEEDFKQTLKDNPKNLKNKPKNVIMVFIDTLRKDHVNNNSAPEMKSFMDQSWSFNHSYSSSVATLPSSFAMFYSQNIHLRSPYLDRFWQGGSPFLQSLKALGYKINIWGSPWQYCIDGSHPDINNSSDTRNGAVSNLYLLYGKTPLDLIGRPGDPMEGHCYRFFDYDKNNPLVRRDPYAWSQFFPQIPYIASSWDGYNGEFYLKPGAPKKEYYHQAYLDHKIVSDAINKLQKSAAHGAPPELNFHFVYLFSVHDPFAWLDQGYPDKIGPGSPNVILGQPTFVNSGPEYIDYLPWKNKIEVHPDDIGTENGQLPSYHTPWYTEYATRIDGPKDNPATEQQKDKTKALLKRMYKNAVVGADYQFHRLIQALKENNLYDDALIILVADHGKYLFEINLQNLGGAISPPNGKLAHFGPPLKQNTEVPIAFKFPKNMDPRIDTPTKVKNIGSHLDIFPTVIDFLAPDLYEDLKSQHLVAGKSVINHDRSCLVTEQPLYDEVNDFVMNNGQEKLYARFSDLHKATLEREQFWALGFLNQNDETIKIDGNLSTDLTLMQHMVIAREKFGECMEELFPHYGSKKLTGLGEESKNLNIYKNIDRISNLPTLAEKMKELSMFPAELVREVWTGNSMINGPAYANYHFLPASDREEIKKYFQKFTYTYDPTNPSLYNPINDFDMLDENSLAYLNCPLNQEEEGANPDLKERSYIKSLIEKNMIKGNEYNVFANNIFFRTFNFQNLVPLYFDKLEKNKRVVAYGFTGSAQLPQNMLATGLSRYGGAVTGKTTNIDLLEYFGGEQSGTLAGFFSATRSVRVAKHFAQMNIKEPLKAGYVYVSLLEGAIVDPENKGNSFNYIAYNKDPNTPLASQYNEQELTSADDVARWKIVAYRQLNAKDSPEGKKFDRTQPIYVRKGLKDADPEAYDRIIRALAGCKDYEPKTPAPPPIIVPPPSLVKPQLLSINEFQLIGAKPGGSVPGGLYKRLSDGKKYIIKYTTHEVAVNEVLASEFYKKAGLKVANYFLIDPGPSLAPYNIPAQNLANYGTKPYRFVAVEYIENLAKLSALEQGQMDEVLDGFIIDAWLANYDTIGLEFDNIMKDPQGHAVRVDIGASLEYFAQGWAKGKGFNEFVYEVAFLLGTCNQQCKNGLGLTSPIHDRLMNKSKEVFGKLKRKNIAAGFGMLNIFNNTTIKDIVQRYGPEDVAKQENIIKTLIRRKAMLNTDWRTYLNNVIIK